MDKEIGSERDSNLLLLSLSTVTVTVKFGEFEFKLFLTSKLVLFSSHPSVSLCIHQATVSFPVGNVREVL